MTAAQPQPKSLSRATASVPAAIEALPERVVQFGEGNFLRAFADWQIDHANRQGLGIGRIVLVQPIAQGLGGMINGQDGLYHVAQQGVQGGVTIDRADLVASVSRCLNPYAEWSELAALARSADTAIVISNTTEAGIAYAPEAKPAAGACPSSFPAKVAAFLLERWTAFNGAADKGLLFLPCELIEANGTKLRDCVLKYAADWQLPAAFVAWVQSANVFCNTLVDRIVPGYPKDEAAAWAARLGYDDKILVATEPFHLWVIEGDAALAERFPLHRAGLNVVWTNDLKPYRSRKVRILNGAHTTIVAASFLAGIDTVRESVEDPVVGAFLRRAMYDEIVPGLTTPVAETRAYADAIMERFSNPFIRHLLLSISLNSVSKWSVRVLPSVQDALAAKRPVPALVFSLAALIAFYCGTPAGERELTGQRNGQPYAIKDDAPILAAFAARWAAYDQNRNLAALVDATLGDVSLWGMDLRTLGIADEVTKRLGSILANGSRAALTALMMELA